MSGRRSTRKTTFYERKQQRDRLVALLNAPDRTPQQIEQHLEELAAAEGNTVYADLLSTLSHLELPGDEAHAHWRGILERQRAMSEKLGDSVDLRVAALDYLLTVAGLIENPKIVEIYLFERTTESAITDGLTELYNIRYFQTCLEREAARARRYDQSFSVLMLDLDGFKPYNDACGHQAGDEALCAIARILMRGTRSVDVVARYGGDEFVIILPEVEESGARVVATRLVAGVAAHEFPGLQRIPGGTLSASAGIAVFPADGGGPRDVLLAADRALYAAKAAGRNQVVAAGSLNG